MSYIIEQFRPSSDPVLWTLLPLQISSLTLAYLSLLFKLLLLGLDHQESSCSGPSPRRWSSSCLSPHVTYPYLTRQPFPEVMADRTELCELPEMVQVMIEIECCLKADTISLCCVLSDKCFVRYRGLSSQVGTGGAQTCFNSTIILTEGAAFL